MTTTIEHPPLLLPRKAVMAELQFSYVHVLWELTREGRLRQFFPNPKTRVGYYLAVDVASMCGRRLDTGWIEALPEWMRWQEFQQHSGLAERALWTALRRGQLAHRRTARGVEVRRDELKRFC